MATSDSAAAQRRTIPIASAQEPADFDGLCGSGEAFALMVLGDSMAPEFTEGDIVIIEPQGLAREGSYVLASVAGEFKPSKSSIGSPTAAYIHGHNDIAILQ